MVHDDDGVVVVNSDDNDTPHPEQPVGEDEGVDGIACLAVPHLQNIYTHLFLLDQNGEKNQQLKTAFDPPLFFSSEEFAFQFVEVFS